MYGVNVVGAGIPGLATVVSPGFAAEYVFGATPDPVSLRMLGSVWLAVGALSLLGFHRPMRFSALFPVEALYKSVWLATVVPTLLAGERPQLAPLAALFAVWVAADLVATSWAYLFARDPRSAPPGELANCLPTPARSRARQNAVLPVGETPSRRAACA